MSNTNKNISYLLNTLNQKEQVSKRTRQKREKAIDELFNELGIDKFKYLQNSKTEYSKNKNIRKATETILKKYETHQKQQVKIQKRNERDPVVKVIEGLEIRASHEKKLRSLEQKFNKKKEQEYNRMIETYPDLSEKDVKFLLGFRTKNVNSSGEMQKAYSFSPEMFDKQLSEGMSINYFLKQKKEQLEDFSFERVLGKDVYGNDHDFSGVKLDEYLTSYVDNLELLPDRKEIITSHFLNLSPIERSNFNANIKTIIQWVDSMTGSQRNKLSVEEAFTEVVFKSLNGEYKIIET